MSANDTFIADIAVILNNLHGYISSSQYNLSGFIRGYNLPYGQDQVYWANDPALHPHFDSLASGIPNSTSSEDAFSQFDGVQNSAHLCHDSAGEIVWMVR